MKKSIVPDQPGVAYVEPNGVPYFHGQFSFYTRRIRDMTQTFQPGQKEELRLNYGVPVLCGGYNANLVMYPNGRTEEDKGYVSIFLEPIQTPTERGRGWSFDCEFLVSAKPCAQAGRVRPNYVPGNGQALSQVFTNGSEARVGWAKFIKHDVLLNPTQCLLHGKETLNLELDLKVFDPQKFWFKHLMPPAPTPVPVPAPKSLQFNLGLIPELSTTVYPPRGKKKILVEVEVEDEDQPVVVSLKKMRRDEGGGAGAGRVAAGELEGAPAAKHVQQEAVKDEVKKTNETKEDGGGAGAGVGAEKGRDDTAVTAAEPEGVETNQKPTM